MYFVVKSLISRKEHTGKTWVGSPFGVLKTPNHRFWPDYAIFKKYLII